jgi:hypothetical protein
MPTESDFQYLLPQVTYGSNDRTLLGFYVQQASSNVSWGDNGSSMNLSLVKETGDFDYLYNDFPCQVGHPMRFRLGGFYFGGILSKVTKKKSTSGIAYDTVLVDPREILQATQVIIGQYVGPIPIGITNVINAYGFWEDETNGLGGFGFSGSDEIGMPWITFFKAVLFICNQPLITPYGGPMRWGVPTAEFPKGVYYSLDLSELPIPDPYYRIEGNAVVSLYDVISKVCQDAGYDFVVELIGYTIKIRTISRKLAPALGTIGAIVNQPGSNATSIEHGIEMAQGHQTASMLIGGPYEGMFSKLDYASFWGYDANKNPILGQPGVAILAPKLPGEGPISYPCDMMNLYAQGVEDVIGSTYYFCTTLELQFAMAGIDSWMEFIEKYRPEVFFAMTGFQSNRSNQVLLAGVNTGSMVQTNPQAILARALEATYDRSEGRRRFFSWLSGVANQHLGKEFIVSLGISASTIDEKVPFKEDLRPNIRYEFDITRSAFMEITEPPINPNPLFAPFGLTLLTPTHLYLSDEQSRFEPFVVYNYQRLIQGGAVIDNPQDVLMDQVGAYVKSSIGDKIEQMYYPSVTTPYSNSPFIRYVLSGPGIAYMGGPLVRMTVQNPIFSKTNDPSGNHSIISRVLGTPADLYQTNAESSKTRIHPPPIYPSFFVVPLKSNRITYGPYWVYSGVPGRVKVEVDSELVPSNYGSEIVMNRVALARLFDGSSQLALTEHGRITQPDYPKVSLGQALQANGPAVTSIEISLGTGGVTSTYAFQNYSPRFGVIPRQTIDRMRKTGQLGLQLRRNLSKMAIDQAKARQSSARASAGAFGLSMTAGAFDKFHRVQTPHECVAGFASPSNSAVRLDVKSAPLHELMTNTEADDPQAFANRAITSQDALFRPYRAPTYNGGISSSQYGISYRTLPDGTSLLPKAELPVGLAGANATNLTPIAYPGSNDISIVTYQQANGQPCEMNNWNAGAGAGAFEARSVGLRGPLMVVGYGQDIYNPGSLTQTGGTQGYRSDLHRAGPTDLFWDDIRKVWTGVGITRVYIFAEGNPASGYVIINGVTTTKAIQVYSSSVGSTISQGFTLATYVPNEQKWYQTSGGSQVYLGNALGFIYGGSTGNANLINRGVKSVYNYLSTPISSGAKVIVAEYNSSYVVVAADC